MFGCVVVGGAVFALKAVYEAAGIPLARSSPMPCPFCGSPALEVGEQDTSFRLADAAHDLFITRTALAAFRNSS
eukprot:15433800-Alexandrium_andersonii.AAC.1